MNQRFPSINPPLRIFPTDQFKRDRESALSAAEYRGLLLVLGDDTKCGKPVAGMGGVLALDFAGSIIHYYPSLDHRTIHLLNIEKVDWNDRPPAANEQRLLRSVLSAATGSAVAVVVRGGLKWIWDLIDF